MEKKEWLVNILGTNIISSLGFSTKESFTAVKSGISGVKHYGAGTFDLPEDFMASRIDREKLKDEFFRIASEYDCTDLEKATILSVFYANQEAQIELSSPKTLFIISTTKGNVDLLENEAFHPNVNSQSPVYLWKTAKTVADFFKNRITPIVVSNACVSGASAQIVAMRALQSGYYDHIVVTGVDFLSKFIVSGFQSFKAVSPELCKPFDRERCGLNLGEAAATIIFSRTKTRCSVSLINGAVRNDANHISAPSRTGEGCLRALKHVLQGIDPGRIAFINAHGTVTLYNDAMEANAIVRAGLGGVPVNSLKAFWGHTLGAAGILESIISVKALKEGFVPGSLNFNEQDFENRINISQGSRFSDKEYLIKTISGFGGVNAALIFKRGDKYVD